MKVLFFICIVSSVSFSKVLDWKECLKIASNENLEIKAAKESLEKAKYNYRSSLSSFYPSLSTSINYSKEKDTDNTYSFLLSSNLSIFNGFNDYYSIKEAELNIQKEEENSRQTLSTVYYSLKEVFIELLYLEKLLELNTKIENRRENNMKMVRLKYLGGREDKGSYLRTQAQYESSIYEISKTKREIEIGINKLSNLLGGIPVSGVKGELKILSKPKDVPDFSKLTLSTPQYLAQKYETEILEKKKSKCISSFLPSISISANYGKRGTKFFPETEYWTIEGNVRFSIFEGFSSYYDCKSAIKDFTKASLVLDNYRLNISQTLREAFLSFVDSFEKLEVQEKTLQSTELLAKILKSKYEQGLTSFTNWDLIENDLIRDEKAVLTYRKDAIISYANWLKELGKWE